MKPKNINTLKFFNYKWRRVPSWAIETERIYIKWYLTRYGFKNTKVLKNFLKNKFRIIEVGSGLARDSKFFSRLNPRAKIYALDQSPFAINTAKKKLKKYQNISFIRHDITKKIKLNFKFDFISADQVIHHTPNPAVTLKNLYNILKTNGYLAFSFCRKKNIYRDLADDKIMNYFKDKKPSEIWRFARTATEFGRAIYNLNIKNIKLNKKKYPSLQNFVHNQLFRCWYDPKINFNLSVSSNYDWFSNNPRFTLQEVKLLIKKSFKKYKLIRIYEDDATISIIVKKK